MKKILSFIFILTAATIFGGEPSITLFFSPVIYKPIMELAAKDENFITNKWNPVSGQGDYSIKGVIHFSDLTIPAEDRQRYDQAFTLTFSLAPHIKYNIYSKDNCIMKLVESDEEKKQEDVYIREDRSDSLAGYPDDYRTLSTKSTLDVYATEDMFPLFRKQHQDIDSIDFEIARYYENMKNRNPPIGSSISIIFPSIPTVKSFSMNDGNLWHSSYSTFAPKSFLSFATTIYKDHENNTEYLGEATVIDEIHNGYSCHFFPNGGIKDYVPIESDKWGDQKVWNKDGILIGTYPFPPGQPVKERPKEYFPKWIDDILSYGDFYNGYNVISAEYWDATAKSPFYKFIFRTPKNGKYIVEFFFSNPNQVDTLDGLYEKTYQKSKDDSSKNKDIILKSPISTEVAIGDKSFGIIIKDIAEEEVFVRGNLLIKIKSQDHRDTQVLARELDKAWQQQNSK